MNRFAMITATVVTLTCSMQSFASPALYTFNAPLYASEVNLDGSDIAAGDYLFDGAASISGTFLYDAATAATAVNQLPIGLGPTGLYSFYEGSIQNLAANVGGYSFSATGGGVLIADADADAESSLDSVFIRSGSFEGGQIGSGFSGFTIGSYHLVSFDLYTVSSAATMNSQALPSLLANGEYLTAVSLVFDNGESQRLVQFGMGNIELAEVPVPASAWLFGSAALILIGRKRQRA